MFMPVILCPQCDRDVHFVDGFFHDVDTDVASSVSVCMNHNAPLILSEKWRENEEGYQESYISEVSIEKTSLKDIDGLIKALEENIKMHEENAKFHTNKCNEIGSWIRRIKGAKETN